MSFSMQTTRTILCFAFMFRVNASLVREEKEYTTLSEQSAKHDLLEDSLSLAPIRAPNKTLRDCGIFRPKYVLLESSDSRVSQALQRSQKFLSESANMRPKIPERVVAAPDILCLKPGAGTMSTLPPEVQTILLDDFKNAQLIDAFWKEDLVEKFVQGTKFQFCLKRGPGRAIREQVKKKI